MRLEARRQGGSRSPPPRLLHDAYGTCLRPLPCPAPGLHAHPRLWLPALDSGSDLPGLSHFEPSLALLWAKPHKALGPTAGPADRRLCSRCGRVCSHGPVSRGPVC